MGDFIGREKNYLFLFLRFFFGLSNLEKT